MKTFKMLLLPAIMVFAGAGSAYATHAEKQNKKLVTQGYAYHPDSKVACIRSSKECDTTGNIICTGNVGMGVENLYELNGTSCPDQLFEKVNP